MALYTVFAPPPEPGETAPDPVRFVFVKDGFCWPALFIPELWLLFRRMWLVFVLYLAASARAQRHRRPRSAGRCPGWRCPRCTCCSRWKAMG